MTVHNAMRIEKCRVEIDEIDNELLLLLNRRARLVVEIMLAKRHNGIAFRDGRREQEILARAVESNAGPMDARAVTGIFSRVFSESLRFASELALADNSVSADRLPL